MELIFCKLRSILNLFIAFSRRRTGKCKFSTRLFIYPAIMQNGSLTARLPLQVMEAQQHGQGTFQLTIQVHFLAGQPRKLVGIEGLVERLCPD